MKTYKVVALSVGGKGKRIFNSGDLVKESDFIAGRAEELVKQGFLSVEDKKEISNKDNKPNSDLQTGKGKKDKK